MMRMRSNQSAFKRLLDAIPSYPLPTVEALGVDPEQDVNSVTGPLGDACWFDAGIEPGGDGGVAGLAGMAGDPSQRSLNLGRMLTIPRSGLKAVRSARFITRQPPGRIGHDLHV